MEALPQLIANSLIAGSIYALAAMSFNFIYSVSRTFNLAHGALGAVAAYGVFFLAVRTNVPVGIAIVFGILSAALVGFMLERAVYRPLRGRRASNYVLLIASLGVSVALEALIALMFSSHFYTLSSVDFLGDAISAMGVSVTGVQILMLVSAVLFFVFFWALLSFTSFGKAVRAIADDEEVARIVGIDTNHIISMVFVLGSAIMGFAGVLAAFDTGLEPHMGFLLLLSAAIASIVGGVGSVYGAFWGAYLIGFAENFGVWFVSGEWKYAIGFGILILFLLFRPQGILGKK